MQSTRLAKGELPPLTGIYTNCKVCWITKDDALFKYQHGKRAGLVCRECDLARKRKVYKTDEVYRESAIARARLQEHNPEIAKAWKAKNIVKVKERRVSYHIENRDRINTKSLAWYENNKESQKAKMRDYYEKNKEDLKAYSRQYYLNNKELFYISSKNWREKNKGLMLAYYRAYNLAKAKRVPKWSEVQQIRDFYANRPKGYEIDHIVPLFGRNVSGLHVIANLQYLTESENSQKSNKFDIEEFNQ